MNLNIPLTGHRVIMNNITNLQTFGLSRLCDPDPSTGDNHVTCVQLSKPDVATLSYHHHSLFPFFKIYTYNQFQIQNYNIIKVLLTRN